MEGLGLDLPSFIGQLISFLILLGLIMTFGYKPIRNILDERAERIKKSLEQAEAIKKEYENAQVEVQKRIGQAREQGEALITQAREMGERMKEEARKEARGEAEAIVNKTRKDLEREQERMVDALRREFADIAVLAAEKVIQESLDARKHSRIIEEALRESAVLSKTKQ